MSVAYVVGSLAHSADAGHPHWLPLLAWGSYLLPTAIAVLLCVRLARARRTGNHAVLHPKPLLHCSSVLVGVASIHTLAWLVITPVTLTPLVGAAIVLPVMILPPVATALVVTGAPLGRPDAGLLRALVLTALVPCLAGIYMGAPELLAALGAVGASGLVAVASAVLALPVLTRALWSTVDALDDTLRENAVSGRPVPVHRWLLAAREGERHRLQRDLHDGLGPALAGLRLRLDTAAAGLAHEPNARGLVVDAATETARVMDEVRRIVEDLRPLDLNGVDLVCGIRRLVTRLDVSGTVIASDLPDHPLALPAATEIAAYRIVGECLTNALRHAGARQVTVRLGTDGDDLVLDVLDDGVGLVHAGRGDGVGLSSIASRAEEIGGRCTVLSRPDAATGTLVRTVLPRFLP